jgi:hypothetical protein
MLAMVVPLALVAACTDAAKAPAEAAMTAAGAAVDSLKGEAVKYAPDAVKAVEATYATAKDAIAKQDYKGALAAAQAIPAQAKEALAKAAATKQTLVDAWTQGSANVAGLIDSLKGKLDSLASAKKLPAGLDKAALAKGQETVAAMQSGLAAATEKYKSGDMASAITKIVDLSKQGTELKKSLGMQ